MIQKKLYGILWGVLLILTFSCKKDKIFPSCVNNCIPININGEIINPVSGEGISNVPITINSVDFSNATGSICLTCPTYKKVLGYTDKTGRFEFKFDLDTSLFETHTIFIEIPRNSNFIVYPSVGFNIYFEMPNKDSLTAFENLKVRYYPKANLSLRFHRRQTDNFFIFKTSHYFSNENGFLDYYLVGPLAVKDSIVTVATAADIYTKIYTTKSMIGIGQIYEQIDSIICKANTHSFFDITY